jgi:hypothetical protein
MSNHADMFQPRLYARCGVVIYITNRELVVFERKYENTWFPNDPYQVGGQRTIAAGLVRRLGYDKITSADIECIVSLFET